MDKLEAVKRSVEATASARPHFLKDPDCDRLLAITLALAAELGTVYERLDTLEAVLAADHGLDRARLDRFEPDAATSKARLEWHDAFVRRVLRVLSQELNELKDSDAPLPAMTGE
jgi:hypothetical protein